MIILSPNAILFDFFNRGKKRRSFLLLPLSSPFSPSEQAVSSTRHSLSRKSVCFSLWGKTNPLRVRRCLFVSRHRDKCVAAQVFLWFIMSHQTFTQQDARDRGDSISNTEERTSNWHKVATWDANAKEVSTSWTLVMKPVPHGSHPTWVLWD